METLTILKSMPVYPVEGDLGKTKGRIGVVYLEVSETGVEVDKAMAVATSAINTLPPVARDTSSDSSKGNWLRCLGNPQKGRVKSHDYLAIVLPRNLVLAPRRRGNESNIFPTCRQSRFSL